MNKLALQILVLIPFLSILPDGFTAEPRDLAVAIKTLLEREYASLEALYKHFHANPELSMEEVQTAKRLAEELRKAGCEVTEKVGDTGVVGILRNGKGPVIMVRADMDGLPIVEKTGLPYASRVRVRDRSGREVGVMHSCGHDINMACMVGTARTLASLKDRWQGTILFVGQPAEEIGFGARRMLADGLFKRFPKPTCALAMHCDARYPHGQVNYREGFMQANVDSVDIVVRGKGGHGAAPQTTVDPIVLAARLVLDLQTIVSREINPIDSAVVTVGSIHGGTKHNIIPDQVELQLTIRTTKEGVRKQILEAIRRKAEAVAQAARAPTPEVRIQADQFIPALENDSGLSQKIVPLFRQILGTERVHERPMSMGGEDFSQFVRAGVPGFYFFLGTAPPEAVEEARRGGRPLALTHTAEYFPVPEPTIKTGVLSMSLALFHLLPR